VEWKTLLLPKGPAVAAVQYRREAAQPTSSDLVILNVDSDYFLFADVTSRSSIWRFAQNPILYFSPGDRKTTLHQRRWAISPGNSAASGSYDPAGSPAAEFHFTAGPDHGTGGLFGYLKPVTTELTVGNDQ
jgi:hypothetical protein